MSFACLLPMMNSIFVSLTTLQSGLANTIAPTQSQLVLLFNTNGTASLSGVGTGTVPFNWATPTTVGVGANYWIRFTATQTLAGGTFTPSTGWLQLNAARNVQIASGISPGAEEAVDYLVQIATDSAGTNIVAFGTSSLDCTIN